MQKLTPSLIIIARTDEANFFYHTKPTRKTPFGYGPAVLPVVEGRQVILVTDNQDLSDITAVDGATGKLRWITPRDERSTGATSFV